MQKISVVIVCRDEEESIGRCIDSCLELSDDIVVLDNGSTDNTKNIVQSKGARLIEDVWEGYGRTKRKATNLAKYDWTINLDADEAIDDELKQQLLQLPLDDEQEVFSIRFKNFIGRHYLRFGEWGYDSHIRLFNRRKVNWDDAIVHENIVLPKDVKIRSVKGHILHYSMKNTKEFAEKMVKYAELKAMNYFQQGKSSSLMKLYFAPLFAFLKYYFFLLGFLDGWPGFVCARMTSYYTFLKYARLKELRESGEKK